MSQLSLFDPPELNELISSQQDTLASPSVQPGSDKARTMTAISGLKCLGLSESVGPLGSLEKMLLGTSLWASTLCSLTWKAKVTPAGHLYFQLQVSAHHTNETESSLWRTPAAANGSQGPKSKEFYEHCLETGQSTITLTDQVKHNPGQLRPTPIASAGGPGKNLDNKRGLQQGNPLATAVAMQENPARMWPTPKASLRGDCPSERARHQPDLHAAVKMWPTTKASDGIMGKTARTSGRPIEKSTHLQTQVHLQERKFWPTPRANDAEKRGNINVEDPRNGLPAAVKLWPTPAAQDGKNSTLPPSQVIRDTVPGALMRVGESGQLNPEWVECLMGFPSGWTDISGLPL